MATLNVPLSITYQTKGLTPIPDIIAALQAADTAIQDATSLLPSLIDGLRIEQTQIHVRALSQESPLRELFLVTLLVAFQDELQSEIPPVIEDLFRTQIPDSYDSIVTIVTMIVIFYGAAFLKDAAVKAAENGALRRQLNNLIAQLAASTEKSEDEIRKILDAKFSKPGPVKRLAKTVGEFFRPSQREGAAAVVFDRARMEPDAVREVPYGEEFAAKEDFERYRSYSAVTLDIHAQDKDKSSTGWAAIPVGITPQRLRMKLIEPVTAQDVWTRDTIKGDITIVSRLTADGYVPQEIHLTRVYPAD